MLKNYFIVALRALRRQPGHAALNITGLAVGIAAAVVLLLFVDHERSFDRHHEGAGDLYLVAERHVTPEDTYEWAATRTPVLPVIVDEVPEVVAGSRWGWSQAWFAHGDTRLEVAIRYADPGLEASLTIPVLAGDLRAALTEPGRVAISASTAAKLFGDRLPEAVLGEVIDIDFGDASYTVAAIVADPPESTNFEFEALGPYATYIEQRGGARFGDNWASVTANALVRLVPGTDPAGLASSLESIKTTYFQDAEGSDITVYLNPITTIRAEWAGNGTLLVLLAVIAGITLLVAVINFTNLATAQALRRSKEVGVRKAIGAGRRQLAAQFLGEALLTVSFALVLALVLVLTLVPTFNTVFETAIHFNALRHGPGLVALGGVLAVMAGAYPALVLSGLRPIETLKGRGPRRMSGAGVQRGLVVVQFALAVVLIAGTTTVWQQVQHLRSQDARFDTASVLRVPVLTEPLPEDGADAALTAARDRLLADSRIESVAFSTVVPSRYYVNFNSFGREGASFEELVRTRQATIGLDYVEAVGLSLLSGRGFRPSDALTREETGTRAIPVLLNETAAAAYGGVQPGDRIQNSGGQAHEVIGIVADFQYRTAAEGIEPLLHYFGDPEPSGYSSMVVRTQPGEAEAGMALLRAVWADLYPSLEFEGVFIDEAFNEFYQAQERVGLIVTLFAGIALALACLGLLALAAYAAQRRTKEVGVRKVLGASVTALVRLLVWDFARLVVVGAVVAIPIAYAGLDRWLDDFATRIDLGPVLFLLAGGTVLMAALLTIGGLAYRAATADPARTLRYE
ncbi:MAG: ABC transporter permease [Bacteroidota bacterium]